MKKLGVMVGRDENLMEIVYLKTSKKHLATFELWKKR